MLDAPLFKAYSFLASRTFAIFIMTKGSSNLQPVSGLDNGMDNGKRRSEKVVTFSTQDLRSLPVLTILLNV